MARIPQDELDRLKREVSIARLAEARGVELKRSGDSLIGLCPFHEETEESFRINEKRNVFHCFGCGAKGSVIDFVMLLEGVSFRHAVEILRAEHQGVPYEAESSAPERPKSQKLPALLDPGVDEGQLRTDVAMYYHEVLGRSPEAKGYVRRRGLDTE